jgi:hypothetical protein
MGKKRETAGDVEMVKESKKRKSSEDKVKKHKKEEKSKKKLKAKVDELGAVLKSSANGADSEV